MTRQSGATAGTPRRAHARAAFLAGVRATGGLAVGGGVFGILFGVIALGHGLSAGDTIFMSAAVFAGSAQVAILELWREPLPYVALFVTAALVCSRHVLMGVTLHETLSRNRRRPPFAALLVLTDANWVLTSRDPAVANPLAFFVGSGVAMYTGWVIGTILGVAAPSLLDARTIAGLSMGGAMYIAILLCLFFRGRALASLVAPVVSAAVTLLASARFDAAVAILAGVAAAAVAAGIREWLRYA